MAGLRALGLPWGSTICDKLTEMIDDIWGGYGDKTAALIDGYHKGAGATAAPDFGAWKKRLQATAGLAPGSPGARKYIDSRIKILLYEPSPPAVPALVGYFKGAGSSWARGKVDQSQAPMGG